MVLCTNNYHLFWHILNTVMLISTLGAPSSAESITAKSYNLIVTQIHTLKLNCVIQILEHIEIETKSKGKRTHTSISYHLRLSGCFCHTWQSHLLNSVADETANTRKQNKWISSNIWSQQGIYSSIRIDIC